MTFRYGLLLLMSVKLTYPFSLFLAANSCIPPIIQDQFWRDASSFAIT